MRPLLVTAGATRNPIDAIRYLSAGSSGTTGVTLARAYAAAGGPVHLMGSQEARLRGPKLPGSTFGSTRDLEARLKAWVAAHPDGVVVHAAAVGDYEARADDSKIPSGQAELVLRLRPAPKILDQVRGWGPRLHLVSFKAAAPESERTVVERIARRQLQRTASDLVFANVIGRLDAGVALVDAAETRWFEARSEALDTLAEHLVAVGQRV